MDAWRQYPGAPDRGTVLCAVNDIVDGQTWCVNVGDFGIVLVRQGDQIRAFVNACPHQYLPLDYRSDQLVSADGTKLICSNHDATFDIETGQGVGGFGQGCELDAIPVTVSGDEVLIS